MGVVDVEIGCTVLISDWLEESWWWCNNIMSYSNVVGHMFLHQCLARACSIS